RIARLASPDTLVARACESRTLASSLLAIRNPAKTRPPAAIAVATHSNVGSATTGTSKYRRFKLSSLRDTIASTGAFKISAWANAPIHQPCQIASVSAAESPLDSLQMKEPVDPATAATNDTTMNHIPLFGWRKSKGSRAVR